MTPDPDTAAPANRDPRCRRRAAPWGWFCHTCRAGWYLALLVVFAGIFLWGIGLPAPWSNRLLQAAWPPARDLEIGRLRLHPVRGILLERVSLYAAPGRPAAATAGRIILRPELAATGPRWHDRRFALREIGIQAGSLHLTPGYEPRFAVSNLVGNLLTADRLLLLRNATASLNGFVVRAHGELPEPAPSGTGPAAVTDLRATWSNLVAQTPAWITNLPLEALVFPPDTPPELNLRFALDPGAPDAVTFSAVGRAGPLTYASRAIDRLTLLAAFDAGNVSLDTLELTMAEKRLHLSGSWNAHTNRLQVHGFSDLPPQKWFALLPTAWKTNAFFTRLDMDGSFTSEAWIGPCPPGQWASHWNGWISADRVTLGGLPVSRGFVSARRRGSDLEVEQLLLHAGAGDGAGTVEARAGVDVSTWRMRGAGSFDLDLRQASGLIPPPLRKVAERFDYRGKPLAFEGVFDASLTNLDYEVTGELAGNDFSYRDIPVDTMRCTLRVVPRLVALDPLVFTKDRGTFEGGLDLHFQPDRYELDVRTTTPPLDSLRMALPRLADQLALFDFNGSSLVEVRGLVDIDTPAHSDLAVAVSASDVALRWFRFGKITGTWRYTGDAVTVTNLDARAYDGAIEGAVDWFDGEPGRIRIDLRGEGLEASRMIADRRRIQFDRDVGRVNARLNLSLPADGSGVNALAGTGRIAVRNGSLLQIPVFGGLSVLLSAIYPGLGYTDQSSFIADFTVADGRVRTDNAALAGNVISLTARGTYGFDDQLDFAVQVKPLKDGILADTLRLVTFPISKLLEFKLTGPVTNAQWRAANLPRLGGPEAPQTDAPPAP